MKDSDRGISRREFIALSGSLLLAGASFGARGEQEPIRQRPIPSSGEPLPLVGLGTARSFDTGADRQERAPLTEVLRAFVEHGGRLVDSSPMYGQAETVVGQLAGELGIHDRLFMATKVWTTGREEGIEQMQRSMDRLGARPMDLMQIHNLVDWPTHLDTLRAWKEEGRVRYIGITHYVEAAFDNLAEIIRKETLDFVQLPYSMGEPQAEDWLLDLCAERGCAVIVNRPYQKGALFRIVRGRQLPDRAREWGIGSWGQYFLKYILSHPAVSCAIPATRKARHVVDNLGAARGYLPNPSERRWMAEYLRSL